ncbi:hypothetical protein GKZ28_07995 [Clostridium chromiireducens]|jgi:hypothetical protein|uniref:Uncharacterized protein n=1 Tax=Clostridium chromiireducens TaxID=225345 RepID=A0A964RLA6_9CLOT|nr:hypothetical protein [Clostridium chromiireducens]MVX63635.1 hypothetical protein [Clostridium chromiireducens]
MNDLPLNIPEGLKYKYVYILEKKYDNLLQLIYDVGLYCTFRQFYALYQKLNPTLTENYIKKKCTNIIKKLEDLGFIEINNINRNKYFYLKKPALALFTGDYQKTPRFNHRQNIKNDKFLISLMKLEYYITNDYIINNSNLINHLYSLTKKIHTATLKYSNLSYNIKDLEYIIQETDYEKIKETLEGYSPDNILKIIWIDIYNIYKRLLLKNQTISTNPTYFKLFIVGNSLRLHYAPNILIFDFHDAKYYEKKLNNLFHEFFSITSNITKDIQSNYKEKSILGNKQYNHIGYTLSLIGYNKEGLSKKILHLNKFISSNPHTPIINDVDYIYIDIAKYIDHSSQYNSALVNADNYVDTHINALLNNQ